MIFQLLDGPGARCLLLDGNRGPPGAAPVPGHWVKATLGLSTRHLRLSP